MHQFYHHLLTPDSREITLEGQECKHLSKVLRKKPGDKLILTDGNGGRYEGVIKTISGNQCVITILEYALSSPFRNAKICIAISPVKSSERLKWFVEKSVEIGIDRIVPLLCKRSERKKINPERLKKISISAMNQSRRQRLPLIDPMTDFEKFIRNCNTYPEKFIAVCHADTSDCLYLSYSGNDDACVLIGPEGGFTREEIDHAVQAGFKPVSLGENRLRTETAALIAQFVLITKQTREEWL